MELLADLGQQRINMGDISISRFIRVYKMLGLHALQAITRILSMMVR